MPSFDKNPTVGEVCKWFQKKVPSLFSSPETIKKNISIDPSKVEAKYQNKDIKVTVKAFRYNRPIKRSNGGVTLIKTSRNVVEIVVTGLTLKDRLLLDDNRALPQVEIEEALLLCYLVVTGVFIDEAKRKLFLQLIQERPNEL